MGSVVRCRLLVVGLGAVVTQGALLVSLDQFGNTRHMRVEVPWPTLAFQAIEVVGLAGALMSKPRWVALAGCWLVALAAVVTFLFDAVLVSTASLLGLVADAISRKFGGGGVHVGPVGFFILALAVLAIVLNVSAPVMAWNRARSD